MLIALTSTPFSDCGLVRKLDSGGALVRARRYTVDKPSGCESDAEMCSASSLDPQCGSSAAECAEDEFCDAGGDGIDVRYNSRTYVLADDASASRCAGRQHGDDYDCVDYAGGAYKLAGKTLKYTVDLSSAGCGSNAAIYMVAMPQQHSATHCADHYCDANAVCGAACIEVDLMEANKVAFVSTVHTADDPNGEAFGIAHYVDATEKRLTARGYDCPYGPSHQCAIDTTKPFDASFSFLGGAAFGYTVTLEQEGRRATIPSPVRYVSKPPKGGVASAEVANGLLSTQIAAGMTLVVSYWSGSKVEEMAWLDAPCTTAEKEWGCHDQWTDRRAWPWTCDKRSGYTPPECGGSFRLSRLRVESGGGGVALLVLGGLVVAAAAAYLYDRGLGRLGSA